MFLPDGRHFFYLNRTLTDLSKWGIDVASIDSSDTTRVISVPNLPTNVAYANGYLVFVRAGTLYAQPFDPIRLAFNGEPAAIAEQVAHDAGTGALFSVSTNGVLVYRSQAASVRTQLTWIDRTGRTVGTIGSVTSQDSPVLSRTEPI